jgi:hypothetical protein
MKECKSIQVPDSSQMPIGEVAKWYERPQMSHSKSCTIRNKSVRFLQLMMDCKSIGASSAQRQIRQGLKSYNGARMSVSKAASKIAGKVATGMERDDEDQMGLWDRSRDGLPPRAGGHAPRSETGDHFP